jgi:hypothetical protein
MKFASAPDVPAHSVADNHNVPANSNDQDAPELITPGMNNNTASGNNLASNSNTDTQPKWNPVNYDRISFDNVNKKEESSPVVVLDYNEAPKSIVADHIPSKANDVVVFSDALYSVLFDPQASASVQNTTDGDDDGQEYISPGQYAMRWVKDKLDGPQADPELAQIEPGDQPAFAQAQSQDKNVDGLDLTQSAVNRVGKATGANISMQQEDDGTYLHLWNYSIRVSQAK